MFAERNGFPPCRRPIGAGSYKICGGKAVGVWGLAPDMNLFTGPSVRRSIVVGGGGGAGGGTAW